MGGSGIGSALFPCSIEGVAPSQPAPAFIWSDNGPVSMLSHYETGETSTAYIAFGLTRSKAWCSKVAFEMSLTPSCATAPEARLSPIVGTGSTTLSYTVLQMRTLLEKLNRERHHDHDCPLDKTWTDQGVRQPQQEPEKVHLILYDR